MSMEMPENVATIENVLKLLVKILKPTIDNSDAESAKVSTVVTSFEDGMKYQVDVTVTPLPTSKRVYAKKVLEM